MWDSRPLCTRHLTAGLGIPRDGRTERDREYRRSSNAPFHWWFAILIAHLDFLILVLLRYSPSPIHSSLKPHLNVGSIREHWFILGVVVRFELILFRMEIRTFSLVKVAMALSSVV